MEVKPVNNSATEEPRRRWAMKRNSIVTALITGVFLVAGSGLALAEWNGTASPESYPGPESDLGRYEFSAPMETGNLPMKEDLSSRKSDTSDLVEKYESGGVIFRKGIDDGT